MANYLLLYKGGVPASDEGKEKAMAAWGEWIKQVGDNMVDVGNPCSNSKRVDSDGEGDVSGDKVTGYSVVKADSMDDAVKCARMTPVVADGGSVDVYETFAAM